MIAAFNEQMDVLEQQVSGFFRRHRSVRIYLSQPGLGRCQGPECSASSAATRTSMPTAKGRKNTPGQPDHPGIGEEGFANADWVLPCL